MTCGVWKPARKKLGVAVASFYSATVNQALALQIGETVQLWEEYWTDNQTVTWCRGCVFNNKNKKGIFPASYIQPKDYTVENECPWEAVVPQEDAIVRELTFVLREWNGRLKSLFVNQNSLFHVILRAMKELVIYRSTLVSNTLTKELIEEIKQEAVTMIDWGNGQLGMDLVPRVHYQQVDPDKMSIVKLFRIHEKSVQNCQAIWPVGQALMESSRRSSSEAMHHLLVNLCSFSCTVGDSAELLLFLYDNKDGSLISEKFVMYFNREGQRDSGDRNSSTIFTDLNSEDLKRDLYLVMQIFRKGRLITEGSFKKVPNFQYRRPWGVSVLCLKDLFQIKAELEYFLRVQCLDGDSFGTLHESLIKRQTQFVGKGSNTQNQGVTLSLKILVGDLKKVKVENPILFSRGVALTQRMGFSDFINPGEIRNDLYLTLHSAEFDRGTKTASKNVEVQVAVFSDKYELIKDCILPANGDSMKSRFYSYVLYHNNMPKWNETIRLSIPIERFNTSHIRLELYHCSNRDKAEKKLFGFSYLLVTTKDSITRLDGKYDLCLYKCDDSAKIKNYLKLPSLREEFNDPCVASALANNMPYQHLNKEFVTVETFLCSSKFAQKSELLNILQWASNPNLSRTIPENLERLFHLKGQDLVRYLQDILDALFNMLTPSDNKRVSFANKIFDALVHIFNLLHDDMFEKFIPVLEDYLEKSFSSPIAHLELMRCLQNRLKKILTSSQMDDKQPSKLIEVLDDIFKFSVRSCILSQRMDGGKSLQEFRDNLSAIFDTFGQLLQSKDKTMQTIQSQLLRNLHKSFMPLYFLISSLDFTQLLEQLLKKINQDPGPNVIKAKTILIQNTINSQLLWDAGSRQLLLPLIVSHLKICLVMKYHMELTANTAGDLLTFVFQLKQTTDVREEVTKINQGLFDVTVKALGTLNGNRRKTCGTLLVACLTEMLNLMDESHYKKLTSDYARPKPLKVVDSDDEEIQEFFNHVLTVFRNLVRADCLPADWITMRMITNNVMLTSIQYIADDLVSNFLQGGDFDRELWYNFFLLAVDFITQPSLQLENYSQAKSSQIKHKYSDMRVPVGILVSSLWCQLGANKEHLMLELIGPFLKITMVPQLELRKATIPIFFEIIQLEYQLKRNLRRVECRMIQELDWLVLEHSGDVDYKHLFQTMLLDKVQAEPELQEEGKRFVFSVTDLLERLLDYREIMDREEQRDTKMHCTFNILNFYKDSRRDMYIRYISRLYELHYSACNFVEAGLTLRLYAQLLSWSQAIQPAEMSYSRQTEADRKEELFSRIMDSFDKGKAWEYGIPLCKELADYYEKTFQYRKLGQILQKQAYFLYQILEGAKLRQDPTYYRVAYFGNTFPPYLKNKAFIYRGDECLKLATIMNQLVTEYPSATILTNNSPPDESFRHGDAQYVQIVSVKPVPSERPEFVGKEVPSAISCFYNTNEVDTFQFDRPYHRDSKDPNNEFKTLCLERTIVQTSYKLPGILRWYEVIHTNVIQLSPVQVAIDTVRHMNSELRTSCENAQLNPEQHLRHLEMRLQGVISGAVNGGIPKYQEAFFNEDYVAKYPGEATYIDKLKLIIQEQLQLLEQGLDIHSKFLKPEMLPLHKTLTDLFLQTKKSMGYQGGMSQGTKRISSISSSSGNLRPGTPSSVSLNSSGSNRSSIMSGCDGGYQEEEYVYVDKVLEDGVLQNDGFLEDVPPPPPPRQRNSPDSASIHSSSSTEKAPPLPTRKYSRTSDTLAELDGLKSVLVQRSPSSRSASSGDTDSCTTIRPQRAVPTPPEDVIPKLPAKRPSMSPLSNKTFGGSSASISSLNSVSATYNNHKVTASSSTNNNDVHTSNLNKHPSVLSHLQGSLPTSETPPPPRALRTSASSPATSSLSTDQPPPIVSRALSISRDTSTPAPVINSAATPPRQPVSTSNSPIPAHSLLQSTPAAAILPPQQKQSAASPPRQSNAAAAPPPLPRRKPSVTPSSPP